jgi:molecular chaperone DnaK (HSP70)
LANAEVQADIKHFPFEVFNKDSKPYIRVEDRGEKMEFVSEHQPGFLYKFFDTVLVQSPEEITSMVLLKMKETAERYFEQC